MARIRQVLRKLLSHTVWGPTGVPASAWRFRNIFRLVLPTTDILFMWFGYVGWANGIASVADATSIQWQAWWSLALGITATVAFIGVALPRLWVAELVSKLFLISLVFIYVALFAVRGLTEPLVVATAGLMANLVLLPLWRLGDLSRKLGLALRQRRMKTR